MGKWESRVLCGISKRGGKVLFLNFSTSRLFHGLGLLFGERRQELSLRAVVSDTVSSNGEGKCVRAYIGQALPLFSLAKILVDDFRLIFAYAVF